MQKKRRGEKAVVEKDLKGKGREGIRRGEGEPGKQGKAQRKLAVKGDLERRIWKGRWI